MVAPILDILKKKEYITTIKLSIKTKSRLDHFREYKRETYEEILQKMLEIINLARNSPLKAQGKLIILDRKKRFKIQKEKNLIKQPIRKI